MLPRGDVASEFALTITCIIYDSFGANTTIDDTLTVYSTDLQRRLEASEASQASRQLSAAVVSEETLEKIRSEVVAANTADEYTEILSIGLEVLNDADCTSAPNCTHYNRQSCTSTDNTCGPCFIDYVGIFGASNSPCTTLEEAQSSASTVGDTCSSVLDCTGFETCVNGACAIEEQPCNLNCSNAGTCIYVGAYDAVPLPAGSTCMIGDVTCMPVCDCDSDRKGAYCAYETAEHGRYTSARYILSVALNNLTTVQDVTSTTSLDMYIRRRA
jgi:hypothetical protein